MRELCDRLAEGVRRALEEGRLAEFLAFLARFRKYSPANAALIFAQRPNATLVAGIRTWNDLGRRVKKGEKGIAIFAPTVRKVKARVEEEDPETGEIREVEREEERLAGFHVAYVFDVSQTEGKPLPEPPAPPEPLPDSEIAERICRRILEDPPAPVRLGCALPFGVLGEFDPRAGEIRISRTVRERSGEMANVLLHEAAHALAFRMGLDSVGMRAASEDGYGRGEALAQGAAFVAAAILGFDTFGMSVDYVAWYVRRAEKLLKYLEDMVKLADALVALVEKEPARAAA
ncbi:MAG: ArdC-like ssDNA-binding domain-containing protein [Moorellales bacterium]